MPGLAEKLVKEFENLQRAHPYETYGARVKKQADELLAKSKRGQRPRRQAWNLGQTFSDDELRLIISDQDFAKQMLKTYDRSFKTKDPTREDIFRFQNLIQEKEAPRLLPTEQPSQMFGQQIYNFPVITQEESAKIREASKAKVKENEGLARKAKLMLGQASRLAPLSPLHTTAKEMLQRNNPDESLALGREEIAAAGRTSVPRKIDPYLKKASKSPAAFLRQYEVDYAPIVERFREEAAKDFLERDLPTINNQFAHKGAFYSGAREAALNKARANKEQRIEQEIARLLMHGREEGMKHYHQHRTGHLKQAEIVGHAHQAEKDSRIRAAEALRVNSDTGQGSLRQHVAALGQLARTEQQQAQNELNVRQLEHREEMERPFIQHARKAAIAQGTPIPTPQLSPESINPPPPSVYGLGSGLIGHMTGLMGQQQPLAKGGHVRRGYAAGDSVKRAASQLQDMRNYIQESPEEAEMRESAQGFKNYRANPMADYLFAAGSHQLANLNGSPMKAFGEGAQLGMRAFKEAQAANLTAQEKYHNLMGKINQTKMDQHQFLAKYHSDIQAQEEAIHQHEAHRGETSRHHKVMEDESRRAHDMMHELGMAKAKGTPGQAIKMSATERKLENDAKKDLLRSLRMKKELHHLSGLVKQTSTGPVIGSIKGILPKTNIDNQIEVGTNKLILDMHQGMKNIPRSEEFLKRIETTKPNRTNYPEANEASLTMMNQGADDVMEHSISTLLAAGWTPEKIEKQFKIKVPEHFLEEGAEEGAEQEYEEGNAIRMMDPEGNSLMVPEDQVEEALSLGATIAQ